MVKDTKIYHKAVPCSECEKEKREIEKSGFDKVIECNPNPDNQNECIIKWTEK